MKRRIYILVAVMCLSLFALTACSSNDGTNNSATDQTATPGTDDNGNNTNTTPGTNNNDADGDGVTDIIDDAGDAIENDTNNTNTDNNNMNNSNGTGTDTSAAPNATITPNAAQ